MGNPAFYIQKIVYYMYLMSIILSIGIQSPPLRQINLLPVAQIVVCTDFDSESE